MTAHDSDDLLLSIIIINYRTPQKTIDCLGSLLPQLQGINCRIIVVDNNSQDDSCHVIGNWQKLNDTTNLIELVTTEFNGGFSFGSNFGIRQANAKYYLLLNSDTIVGKNTIKTLVATAEKYPNAGIVSPRIEWENGELQDSCFRFLNPLGEFCKSAQTGIIDILFSRHVVNIPSNNEVSFPDWTSFCSVLIKAKVIDDIGYLDEGYFMYFEDVEYCMRARRSGWEIANNPEASVIHFLGGSSAVVGHIKMRKRLPRFYYEARSRYFYQAYGRLGLAFANTLWLLGYLVSQARRLLGRKDKALVRMQWKDIWINCSHPLRTYTHPDTVDYFEN